MGCGVAVLGFVARRARMRLEERSGQVRPGRWTGRGGSGRTGWQAGDGPSRTEPLPRARCPPDVDARGRWSAVAFNSLARWCGVLCSFGSGFLSGRLLQLRFSRQTIICDSTPLVYGAPSNAAETVFALPHALTHPRSPRQVARRWMDGGVAGCGGWRRRLNEAVAEKKKVIDGG